MRKKSHISLANYLLKSMEHEALGSHKKAFYIGSILPDCVPSFITRKHNINETFDILKDEILKITDYYDIDRGIGGYYTIHLGIITHYIADYFTYPHNDIFTGNLREHCTYESDLKYAFRAYVKSDEAIRERSQCVGLKTVDDILNFIIKMHKEYLMAIKIVKVDCTYIVELCHKVVDAILRIFEFNIAQNRERTIELA